MVTIITIILIMMMMTIMMVMIAITRKCTVCKQQAKCISGTDQPSAWHVSYYNAMIFKSLA